jgi:hypothetical protein
MDGVDVAGYAIGDVMDLDAREAKLLIAERWTLPEPLRPQVYRRQYMSLVSQHPHPLAATAERPSSRRGGISAQ